ncbi:MAG: ABC transporter permease [Oscillatoria sp. PMC 1068.18]|nr:ABC transporter permease [Oscillatoria sp. PMC 1076.18]MEC4991787.1 ABC transporter permease [Oscillatoria sp. PMC 1068.18]
MLELFLAEIRRSWIEFIRYPMEAIGGVFVTTIIFYGLFLGAKYVAGASFTLGDRLEAIIIGYVLWTLVLFVINNTAGRLQYEAQTGTLEQVFLSPFGATTVFFLRAIASLILQLLIEIVILVIIITLTGSKIEFPLILFLPLLTVLLGAYGLAFIMGALALLFKRVQQLLGLFQFGLLFLLATPLETLPKFGQSVFKLLPMTLGANILRDLMARNTSINWLEFSLALVNGLVYLVIGLLIFRFCAKQVKKRGSLSGY